MLSTKKRSPPTHHCHSERHVGSELGAFPVKERLPAGYPHCSEIPEHRGQSAAGERERLVLAEVTEQAVCLVLLQVPCIH